MYTFLENVGKRIVGEGEIVPDDSMREERKNDLRSCERTNSKHEQRNLENLKMAE
jgi:hypothetical protein